MLCCVYCRAVLKTEQWLHHKCVRYTGRLGSLLVQTTKHRNASKRLTALT